MRDITRKPLILLGFVFNGLPRFHVVDTRDKPGASAERLALVEDAEHRSAASQERPPGEVSRSQLVALGRVQPAGADRPAVPGITGQLVAQLEPQQLVGRVRHPDRASAPELDRAHRHLQKLRHVSRRPAQAGEHATEAEASLHAGFSVAACLFRFLFDLPRCIS